MTKRILNVREKRVAYVRAKYGDEIELAEIMEEDIQRVGHSLFVPMSDERYAPPWYLWRRGVGDEVD